MTQRRGRNRQAVGACEYWTMVLCGSRDQIDDTPRVGWTRGIRRPESYILVPGSHEPRGTRSSRRPTIKRMFLRAPPRSSASPAVHAVWMTPSHGGFHVDAGDFCPGPEFPDGQRTGA